VRSDAFLPFILEELNKGGIPDKDIFIVLGNGAHRDQNVEEMGLIVGKEAYSKVRVYNHHCKDKDELTYLGKTTYGTPVELNKRIVEADRIVLTGGIVYHFLYGWSGGKKGSSSWNIIVISNLFKGAVKDMNMIPAKNINEALEIAYRKLGNHSRTYIIPHSSITFPIYKKGKT